MPADSGDGAAGGRRAGWPLRSYRGTFRQERVLHAVGDLRLPWPVTLQQAGAFAVSLAACWALWRALPIRVLVPGVVWLGLVPGAMAWALTRLEVDGRSPAAYLAAQLAYLLRPRARGGLRPIRSLASGRAGAAVSLRATGRRMAAVEGAVVGRPPEALRALGPAYLRLRRRGGGYEVGVRPPRSRAIEVELRGRRGRRARASYAEPVELSLNGRVVVRRAGEGRGR